MSNARASLILCLLAVLAANTAHAQPAAMPAWCALDDPAAARAQKCPAIEDQQALPVQLALPLPCDGYLMLRKVIVPSATVLDEQTVYLGGAAAEPTAAGLESVTNGPVQLPLAGGFFEGTAKRAPQIPASLDKLQGRAYYIAKYPLTEPQRRRIDTIGADVDKSPSEPACRDYAGYVASLRSGDVRPATNMSWFGAVDILRRYQDWLLSHDRAAIAAGKAPQIPWEQGSPAYLRLPTEAEWEYAARGGGADKQDQSQRAYRIRDPQTGALRMAEIEEIAPLQEAGSDEQGAAAARLGRKLPNLLELYDMIGNAAQIVLEPFRLTRPEQLHGQAGGYIVKGGDVFTSQQIVGVGHRREVPYFDLSGETHSPTVGFRPVLSLPVFISGVAPGGKPYTPGRQNPSLIAALVTARAALASSSEPSRAAVGSGLAALSKANEQGALDQDRLRGELASIRNDLDRSNARLADADRENERQKFEGAVLLAYSIRTIGANNLSSLLMIEDLREKNARTAQSAAERGRIEQQLELTRNRIAEIESGLTASFGHYVGIVMDLARLDPAARSVARDAVHRSFVQQGIDDFYKDYQATVIAETEQLAAARSVMSDAMRRKWLEEIDATRERRGAKLQRIRN